MCSDSEGLAQRYEEWNAMYGSGTDAKRDGRRGREAFSMYV